MVDQTLLGYYYSSLPFRLPPQENGIHPDAGVTDRRICLRLEVQPKARNEFVQFLPVVGLPPFSGPLVPVLAPPGACALVPLMPSTST